MLKKNTKVLQMSAYFEPEQISSTHLMSDLYQSFAENGIEVEDYVPTPCRGISNETRKKYKKVKSEYKYNGFYHVNRFSMFAEGKNPILRAVRYLLINAIQYIKGVNAKDIDVIFAGSTPPTQGLLCGLVKKRIKVPFVYNLQDIFPDSLVNANMTHEGSLIWKIGRMIEDFTYKSADIIIVISKDFKCNLISKGVPEDKIVVVPNWINTDDVYPVKRSDNILFDRFNLDKSKFYICYSGNIGHSQNLELLISVADVIKDIMPDVIFIIFGEGAAKTKLETIVAEKNLDNMVILPLQPYEDIAHVFSLGDAGLIISKPGIGKSSVPSKTWGIMAAGIPVLASFDEDSRLATIIRETGSGIISKAGSIDELINGIQSLYNNSDYASKMGNNGLKYICSELSRDKCTARYVDILKMICDN